MSNASPCASTAGNKFREVATTTESSTTKLLAEGLTALTEALRELDDGLKGRTSNAGSVKTDEWPSAAATAPRSASDLGSAPIASRNMEAIQLPPPGCYVDPSGKPGRRYFDGTDWGFG